MGLASKLAAANANAGGGAGPTSQSTYPGQQAPPPAQYGQPPHQSSQPPQSSYPGQGQQQPQYRAPAGPPPTSGPRPGSYAPPSGPPPSSTGGGQPSYGQPPPSQSPYGAPPGAPPQQQYGQQQYGQQQYGQQQYGQQRPSSQYGQQPPSSQYGQQQPYHQQAGGYSTGQPAGYGPPPTGAQQYGGAPQPAGASGGNSDPRYIAGVLAQCVQEQRIQAFYPPGSLEPLAQRVAQSGVLDRIAQEWRMPKEIASDLVKLSLFDTILYIDDSGSMAFEQGGERIDDMKLILNRVSYACSLFDQDGISVRFMNSNVDGDNITDERAAAALLERVRFSGLTPLGTSMDRKILQPLVIGPARANRLQKPVLIITITDGAPAGEDRYAITKVITSAKRELARTRYGADAVSFQIAQVGEDQKAQAFLAELDNHPEVGELVDVTSSYEMESAEMLAKSGQELTPELWLVKLLLGGIDDSYDEKDEK